MGNKNEVSLPITICPPLKPLPASPCRSGFQILYDGRGRLVSPAPVC